MRDARGLSVSNASADAVAAVDVFRDELLSVGPGVVAVLEATEAHPDVPLLAIYAAALGAFGQSSEGDALCARHLARADALAGAADDRERALLAAVHDLHARRHAACARRLEALIKDHPRDLVAAKLLEFDYYLMGQQHSGARFLGAMEGIAAENRDEPLFGSMHAFALELTGRYDRAIAVAGEATERRATNPWADHALAHALQKSGRIGEGIDVLARRRALWADRAPFVRGHNTWHLALLRLETLDVEGARSALGEAILPAGETPLLVQVLDAISLLWRIEMAGGTVEEAEWGRLADLSEAEAGGAWLPFQSAHLFFALARSGREAAVAEARTRLADEVAALDDEDRAVWTEVGLPVVDGSVAFARGDDARAVSCLLPVADRLAEVGGSDAQVDLFRQAALIAFARGGALKAAERLLASLAGGHPPTPLQERFQSLM